MYFSSRHVHFLPLLIGYSRARVFTIRIYLSCGIVISIVIDIRTKNDGRRDGATIRRCLVIGSRNGKATGLTSRSYSRDLASSSCLVFPLVRDVSPTPSFLGSFVRSKGSFPLCLSDRLARIAVRLSLSPTFLSPLRVQQPIFTLPMHESIFTSACLSINPSRPFYPSSFVSNPHLGYSSTHRSLRFTPLPAPRFSPWLVYFSIAQLSCSRAIEPISSIGTPTYTYAMFSYLYERAWNVVERAPISVYIYTYILYILSYLLTYLLTYLAVSSKNRSNGSKRTGIDVSPRLL